MVALCQTSPGEHESPPVKDADGSAQERHRRVSRYVAQSLPVLEAVLGVTMTLISIRRVATLAACLFVSASVAACGGGQDGQVEGAASELLSEAADTATSVVNTVRDNLGIGTAAPSMTAEMPSEEPEPAPAVPARAAAPRRAPRAASASVAPPAPVAAEPIAANEPAQLAKEPATETLAAAVVDADVIHISETVTVTEWDETLYSATDNEVAPPKSPLPSALRPWRANPEDPGSSIEVVVSRDGSVEKVRLLSSSNWTDAMLLSHIKMWQFEPAVKSGAPVRYRVRLESPIVAP